MIAEFEEAVHYREMNPGHERRNGEYYGWREGIWLGLASRSNESFVGTPQGIVRTAVFKRKPPATRWDFEKVNAVRGTVRCPDPAKPDRDEVPI